MYIDYTCGLSYDVKIKISRQYRDIDAENLMKK